MGANPLINLHTHTLYSDGDFQPEAIVSSAAKGRLDYIAITDHFETSKVHCLSSNQFSEYLERIKGMSGRHDGLHVLAGVEIDTNKRRCKLDSLPIDLLNQLDLVLFEYVDAEEGSRMEEIEDLIREIKVPCGLAHNNIAYNYANLDPDEVADLFSSLNLFVELNTAWLYNVDGLPFYARAEDYYRAFKGKVRVSVGSDTHHDLETITDLKGAYTFIKNLGLEKDLLFRE